MTKVSSSDNSDEHSTRTNYTVEGYDVSSETLFRGECTDVIHFDHEGKASMHIICVVPGAGREYDVKLRPTSFSFPCDTPDGKCPGTDPNVDRYAYSAYTIRYQEERKKK